MGDTREMLEFLDGLLFYFNIDSRNGQYPGTIAEVYASQIGFLWESYREVAPSPEWNSPEWLRLRAEPFYVGSYVGLTAHHALFRITEAFLWCVWRTIYTHDSLVLCQSPCEFPRPSDDDLYFAEWRPIADTLREAGLLGLDLEPLAVAMIQEEAKMGADPADNKTDEPKNAAKKRGRRSDPERDKALAAEFKEAKENGWCPSQAAFARDHNMTPAAFSLLLKRDEEQNR